jgi:hypothetical protein
VRRWINISVGILLVIALLSWWLAPNKRSGSAWDRAERQFNDQYGAAHPQATTFTAWANRIGAIGSVVDGLSLADEKEIVAYLGKKAEQNHWMDDEEHEFALEILYRSIREGDREEVLSIYSQIPFYGKMSRLAILGHELKEFNLDSSGLAWSKIQYPMQVLFQAYDETKYRAVKTSLMSMLRDDFDSMSRIYPDDDAAFLNEAKEWYKTNRDAVVVNPHYGEIHGPNPEMDGVTLDGKGGIIEHNRDLYIIVTK